MDLFNVRRSQFLGSGFSAIALYRLCSFELLVKPVYDDRGYSLHLHVANSGIDIVFNQSRVSGISRYAPFPFSIKRYEIAKEIFYSSLLGNNEGSLVLCILHFGLSTTSSSTLCRSSLFLYTFPGCCFNFRPIKLILLYCFPFLLLVAVFILIIINN